MKCQQQGIKKYQFFKLLIKKKGHKIYIWKHMFYVSRNYCEWKFSNKKWARNIHWSKKIKYKQTEDLCCLREIADQNNRRFMMTKKTEEWRKKIKNKCQINLTASNRKLWTLIRLRTYYGLFLSILRPSSILMM